LPRETADEVVMPLKVISKSHEIKLGTPSLGADNRARGRAG